MIQSRVTSAPANEVCLWAGESVRARRRLVKICDVDLDSTHLSLCNGKVRTAKDGIRIEIVISKKRLLVSSLSKISRAPTYKYCKVLELYATHT